jgi:YaiO family outer membrane protein
MNASLLLAAASATAFALPAPAAAQGTPGNPDSRSAAGPGTRSSGQVQLEYTDFSNGFGNRKVGTLEYDMDFGGTRMVLTAQQGRREYVGSTFDATRGAVSVSHDWSERFYTRTAVSVSTNDPVFPTFDAQQEFNFRVTPELTLQAGARYVRYYGGRDAVSWQAGGTWYFRGGSVGYRYTGYDVEGLGTTAGHTVTLRIDDPGRGRGFTQAWLGAGNNVQEYESLPQLFRGHYYSVALRRVQPLTELLALNLGVTQAWYDTGLTKYEGTTFRVGLGIGR